MTRYQFKLVLVYDYILALKPGLLYEYITTCLKIKI